MSRQHYADGALVESWDDATRTYTDHTTDPPTTRPYTADENEAADAALAAAARLDDLEARVAALEALHTAADPDDPADPDVPTWADLTPAGWWYHGTLLSDDGTVWRNVSGSVLTTPPSAFPGSPSQWTHLFVAETTGGEPDPDPVDAPAWAPGVAYAVGDRVTYDGTVYVCAQSHTSQEGWTPAAVPALWTPAAP